VDIEEIISDCRKMDPLLLPLVDPKLYPNCDCPSCRLTCHNLPGFWDPMGFLKWIASLVIGEITAPSFLEALKNNIKFVQLDFWFLQDKNKPTIGMLRPRTQKEIPGRIVGFSPKGTCIFLCSTGCSLTPLQRPVECLTSYACNTPRGPYVGKGELRHPWDTDLGRKVVELYSMVAKQKLRTDWDKFENGVTMATLMRMKKETLIREQIDLKTIYLISQIPPDLLKSIQ